jgi:hypothetical protein
VLLTLLVLLFSSRRRRRVGRFRREEEEEEEEEEDDNNNNENNEALELENSWKFDVNKKAARRFKVVQTIQTKTERRRRKNGCW